jgi:hypothetical protein
MNNIECKSIFNLFLSIIICINMYYLYIYYLSLNNKSIIIIHRYLGFKFIIYMVIGNNEYLNMNKI